MGEPQSPDDERVDPPSLGRQRLERQLEVAQEITHIGSWEWNLATNVVTWSDELYRIYGFAPRSQAITLEFFLSRLHPDDRARIHGAVQAALARGGRFAYPERIVRPDGSIRHLDTVGEVVSGPDGKPVGLIGTCRDVTEERARDETVRLYADLVRNAQIGLSVWAPDGQGGVRLVAFNPACEAIAGRSLEGEIGRRLHEILPYAQGGRLEAMLDDVARDGRLREAIVPRSRDPENPTRALSLRVFPLPGGRVGVALEDITARVRAERLRDREQRVLEKIASGAPLQETLALVVETVEEHSPALSGSIVLLDPAGKRVELTAVGPETQGVRVWSIPVHATDGRVVGTFAVYGREPRAPSDDDVRLLERASHLAGIAIERRQLEDQLRALSAHVESIREEERTGIARAIHDDLGQSLTALKMDLAWIGRRLTSESFSREAVLEKLSSMTGMTDDVIDRVRRISTELRPGVLDDLGLLAAVEWQAQAFERRTGNTCRVTSNLHDRRLDRTVSTAVFRVLQQALDNVTRHADATHVEIALTEQRSALRLAVHDDGRGITPEESFAPWALGLLGMRERARQLGGHASVRAAPEGGTLVELEIPLVEQTSGGRS